MLAPLPFLPILFTLTIILPTPLLLLLLLQSMVVMLGGA